MRSVSFAAMLLTTGTALADWEYITVVDDFDGTTNHILQTQSELAINATDGEQYRPAMQLRCEENGQPVWRLFLNAIIGEDFNLKYRKQTSRRQSEYARPNR